MIFVIFPLLLLIFHLFFNFCQFDYCVSQCIPPWVYPFWDSLDFLDLVDYFLSLVRKVFSYCLFKIFLRSSLSLFSFWDPFNRMLVYLMLLQSSLRLSSSLFILFSVFYSVAVISTILSSWLYSCSSASVILLLILSSILFIPIFCSLVLLSLW